MAAIYGDGASVRQLGQALLRTAGELSSVTDALSRRVEGLVPEAWSGHSADAFSSDWDGKAGEARQLAAVCSHVGQVLTGLADAIDGANRQAAAAQQMTGGPASRFADPVAEQKTQQMLSQASGAANQARAAARSKLAGLQVPRIGPPLTASQVDAWAARLVPGRVPVFTRLSGTLLEDVKDFARRTGLATAWGEAEKKRAGGLLTIGQEAHFAEGIVDGLTGMLRGVGDLLPGPDGGLGRWLWGDSSASQSWEGLSHLAAPFLGMADPESPAAMEGFGKSLVAWDEWHKDPARAAGNVFFNVASLFAGTKLLSLKPGTAAADTAKAGETGGATEEAVVRDEPGRPPGPPPVSFGRPTLSELSNDRLDLPSELGEHLEYRELRTSDGQPVPLFDGTPVPEQVTQGDLDDCGVVTALRATARYSPEAIKGALREAPDGRVILRVHEVKLSGLGAVPTGRVIEVPVSREVPVWQDSRTLYGARVTQASWAAFAEKGLAAADRTWTADRIGFNDTLWRKMALRDGMRDEGEIKKLIDARGYARLNRGLTQREIAEVMAQLTGERASAVLLWKWNVESVLSRLTREHKPIIVGSRGAAERVGPSPYGVRSDHAYEVTGIEDGKVILKNPWGHLDPSPVPIREFSKEFNNLIVTLS